MSQHSQDNQFHQVIFKDGHLAELSDSQHQKNGSPQHEGQSISQVNNRYPNLLIQHFPQSPLEDQYRKPKSKQIQCQFDEIQHPAIEQNFNSLSKQEEEELFFGLNVPSMSQNLLDLSLREDEDIGKLKKFNKFDGHGFVEDRLIEISGPVTIQEGYITSYKLYKIKTKKKTDSNLEWETVVERRFSDFQYLHQALILQHGGYLIPELPEKSMWTTLNMQTNQYIQIRKQKLKKYLQAILSHNKLRYSQYFLSFLFDRQNNFSERKGEYTQQNSLQDRVYELTTSALGSGYSLVTQYISKTGIIQASPVSFLMNPTVRQQSNLSARLPNSKEEQELLQYEVMINSMSDILNELETIVGNTCTERQCVSDIFSICESLSKDADNQQMNQIKTQNKSRKYSIDRYSIDTAQSTCNNRYSRQMTQQTSEALISLASQVPSLSSLTDQFNSLKSHMHCFTMALGRYRTLAQSLKTLNIQYTSLSSASKNNPRNIELDIIRSKIKAMESRISKVRSQLLEEFAIQVIRGKGMIAQFGNFIAKVRVNLYHCQPSTKSTFYRVK